MKRNLARVLLAASAAAALAAIWAPGAWWKWLLTAAVLFVAGIIAEGLAAAEGKP